MTEEFLVILIAAIAGFMIFLTLVIVFMKAVRDIRAIFKARVEAQDGGASPSASRTAVARQYGVTIKELMDWNDKKDFTLSVGEKLRVRAR